MQVIIIFQNLAGLPPKIESGGVNLQVTAPPSQSCYDIK